MESDEVSQPLDGGFPAGGGVRRVKPPGDNPVVWLAPTVTASDPAGQPQDAQNRAESGRIARQFAHSMRGIMTHVLRATYYVPRASRATGCGLTCSRDSDVLTC